MHHGGTYLQTQHKEDLRQQNHNSKLKDLFHKANLKQICCRLCQLDYTTKLSSIIFERNNKLKNIKESKIKTRPHELEELGTFTLEKKNMGIL